MYIKLYFQIQEKSTDYVFLISYTFIYNCLYVGYC